MAPLFCVAVMARLNASRKFHTLESLMSYCRSSDRLGHSPRGMVTMAVQSALRSADHRVERLLKVSFRGRPAARHIAWQRHHGTCVVPAFQMLLRQVSADDLPAYIGRF